MNDVSSRSHAVFQITVEQMTTDKDLKDNKSQIKVGKLNLVFVFKFNNLELFIYYYYFIICG